MKEEASSGKRYRNISSITPKHSSSVITHCARNREAQTNRFSMSKSQMFLTRRSSLSDSDTSEASCLEKKFYRCGCLNHSIHGCGHRYQNYLAELREERMRKKQKLIEYFNRHETKSDDLVLSDDTMLLAQSFPVTPPRPSQLQKIAEINESAEFSKKKFQFSISVSFGGQQYEKRMFKREDAISCIHQIESLILG